MKNFVYLLILVFCVSIFSCSEPPAPVKIDEKTTLYGDEINMKEPMTLAELTAKMADQDELKDVLVEGEIVSTCAHKGCWMTIQNGADEPMRVRFKDYAFFVPTEGAEGKKTMFEGKAFKEEVSVDWQHHYIDDSNTTDTEKEKLKAAITEPKDVVSFEATGVVIVD